MDSSNLAGLRTTIGYIDAQIYDIKEISSTIFKKVKGEVEKQNAIRKAEKLFGDGKFQASHDQLSDAQFSKEFDALIIKADALHRLQKYNDAIELFQKASKIRPYEFLPYFLLGVSCFRARRFEDAVKYYARAHKIDPDHVTVIQDAVESKKWRERMENPLTRWYYSRKLINGSAMLRNELNKETIEEYRKNL